MEVKLLIAMCSARDVKPQTSTALCNLVGWTLHNGNLINLKKLDILNGVSESCLSRARQKRLDFALEGDYTHLVLLDDDMLFPHDSIYTMLAHNVDFVCANAAQKIPDIINGVCLDFDGRRISSSHRTGLEEIGWGSLAVSLIRIDAIRNIPKPHFEVVWSESLNNYVPEDHYFIKKLREHGVKQYCDHDLTQSVKHIGDYMYGFQALACSY